MDARWADFFNVSGGCTIDGMAASCSLATSMLNSGAAVQCPDNDCSLRGIYDNYLHEFVGLAHWDPNAQDAGLGIGGPNGYLPMGINFVGGSTVLTGWGDSNLRQAVYGVEVRMDRLEMNHAGGQKSKGKLCDERLAGIFGGEGAVFATDRDPDTLTHGAGRDRLSSPSESPVNGAAHIYGDPKATGSADAYVYTPKGYSSQTEGHYSAHADTEFPELQNYHQFTYLPGSLKSFGYSGGLVISFVHTGPTDRNGTPAAANVQKTNAVGSVAAGVIGNYGGEVDVGGSDEGYVHTHLIFYQAGRNGARGAKIDPRSVFCHDPGF